MKTLRPIFLVAVVTGLSLFVAGMLICMSPVLALDYEALDRRTNEARAAYQEKLETEALADAYGVELNLTPQQALELSQDAEHQEFKKELNGEVPLGTFAPQPMQGAYYPEARPIEAEAATPWLAIALAGLGGLSVAGLAVGGFLLLTAKDTQDGPASVSTHNTLLLLLFALHPLLRIANLVPDGMRPPIDLSFLA